MFSGQRPNPSFRMRRLRVWAGVTLLLAISAMAADQKSSITIHVGKTGMFSAVGHEHTIVAPIDQATIDTKQNSVEIVVAARQIKVMDPGESDSTKSEIQGTMLSPKVLDPDKYPEIRFKSSKVEQTSPQHYRVTGTLNLHGKTNEITLEVSGAPDHYHGKTKFKQTDFGIEPVSAGGGTVKVRDELELEFDLYPGEFASANRH